MESAAFGFVIFLTGSQKPRLYRGLWFLDYAEAFATSKDSAKGFVAFGCSIFVFGINPAADGNVEAGPLGVSLPSSLNNRVAGAAAAVEITIDGLNALIVRRLRREAESDAVTGAVLGTARNLECGQTVVINGLGCGSCRVGAVGCECENGFIFRHICRVETESICPIVCFLAERSEQDSDASSTTFEAGQD